ncbi:hypothetical protein Aperf_G00000049757 [Anoplocephala perfoliata]
MPLLDDDRFHLFIILLLIPVQIVIWNYIHAPKTDIEPVFKPSVYFKSNPLYVFDFAKNITKKLYHKAINRLYSIDVKKLFAIPLSMRSSPKAAPAPQPPKIVELHERNHVFFGANQRVDHKRTSSLRFSIGQVVRHRLGFKAVVIGWDEFARAPSSWMVLHYPRLERELEVRQQPNYRLLADSKDTLYQIGPLYVPQDELVALTTAELKSVGSNLYSNEPIIHHSTIPEFFDFFDGIKFSPRPWLRRIYPQG